MITMTGFASFVEHIKVYLTMIDYGYARYQVSLMLLLGAVVSQMVELDYAMNNWSLKQFVSLDQI